MNNSKLIEDIDLYLLRFLQTKRNNAKALDPHLASFIEILIKYLKKGGKHIRSVIFYKAYMSGYDIKNSNEIKEVAGIFELFQAFALIHDDIIDKEKMRRGKQTIHEQYGVPTALLLGNIALMYSDEILLSVLENGNFFNKKLILKLYQEYKQEVMLGQYLDSLHIGAIKTIVHLKTSQYTFVKPVKMGLLFSEEKENTIVMWGPILERLGETFQLKDDYKNIFSTSESQGKDRMSDIKEGKKTQLVDLLVKRADKKELTYFYTIFDKKNLSDKKKVWIIQTMTRLNIKNDIGQLINEACSQVMEDVVDNFSKSDLTSYIAEVVSLIKI